MKISREEISSFKVETKDGETKKIVISQKTAAHYAKETSYAGKYFNLDSIDGPSVEKTDRENLYRAEDGNVLRRR